MWSKWSNQNKEEYFSLILAVTDNFLGTVKLIILFAITMTHMRTIAPIPEGMVPVRNLEWAKKHLEHGYLKQKKRLYLWSTSIPLLEIYVRARVSLLLVESFHWSNSCQIKLLLAHQYQIFPGRFLQLDPCPTIPESQAAMNFQGKREWCHLCCCYLSEK